MAETEPTVLSARVRRQRKTCVQCAKSKRKCDQTSPWCRRCTEKGIVCTYPPKRTIFAAYNLTSSPLNARPSSPAPEATVPSWSSLPSRESSAPSSGSGRTPDSGSSPPSDHGSLNSSEDDISPYQWFLAPDSWLRQYSDQAVTNIDLDTPVSRETLPHFINKLQSWTRSYAADGHSPLFHRQLYKSFMPDTIRDAYTSRAAYDMASTQDSKTMALRIIEDRTNQLIQSQPDAFISSEIDPSSSRDPAGGLIDTCTHLARTQALLIYQLTRLFDGDIRARSKAEAHIDTLHSWARQMIESARIDCMVGQSTQATSQSQSQSQSHSPDSATGFEADMTPLCEISLSLATIPQSTSGNDQFPDNIPIHVPILPQKPNVSLWRVWVIAESVRRTYLASEFMLAVYQTMKDGWSVCPGGAVFCAQEGIWDALSGVEWCKALKETRGKKNREWVLMQSLGSGRLLKEARPDEVDLFAKGVMDITVGMERVEKWCMGG
ncbi:hypothetical protein QBC44DRAFT_296026 [Cladorrhinum sp. PSN332]|nr:hypothetical protein QBC44DRAFT_296026 [Cladorrhinum sp. PSN332]